jgi:hypothetical protein
MNGYIVYYNGKTREIYANSSYEAYVKAVFSFNAPKKKAHLVTVMLAEKEGEQVTHVPDF